MKKLLLLIALIMVTTSAFAQEVAAQVQEVGLTGYILAVIDLVKNIKSDAITGVAIVSGVLVLLTQGLKLSIFKGLVSKIKPAMLNLINIGIGQVLAVIAAMAVEGVGFMDASIAALITSGGAVLFYNAYKAYKATKTK